MRVPLGGSPYFLVTTGAGRFIGLTDTTVLSSAGEPLPAFAGKLDFCLVNRSRVEVVLGAGTLAAPESTAAPETTTA